MKGKKEKVKLVLKEELSSLEGIRFESGEDYLSPKDENLVLEIKKQKTDVDKIEEVLTEYDFEYNGPAFYITDEWGKVLIDIVE